MNNNWDIIVHIVEIVLSVLSPLAAFVLGRLSTKVDENRKRLKDRFDHFYYPYIIMNLKTLNKDIILNYEYSDEIYFQQLYYASNKTQRMVLELFYEVNLSKGKDVHYYRARLKDLELTMNIYKEYTRMCKKLRYPIPALPALESLIQNTKLELSSMEQQSFPK